VNNHQALRLEEVGFEQAGGMSLAALFERRVEETPDAPAIRAEFGQLTFAEWHRRVAAIAGILHDSLGSLAGERVLIWMSHNEVSSFVAAVQAMSGLAAVAVPVDDRSTAFEAQGLIRETDPKAILIGDQVIKNLGSDGAADLGLPATTGAGDPDVVRVLAIRGGRISGQPLELSPELATTGMPKRLERPESAAFIFYTSGSSGRPKGVVWTQATLVQYAERAAHAIYALPRGGRGLKPRDVLQSPIPLYTAASLMENLYPAIYSGCTLVYEGRRFEPSTSEARMRELGTTVYNAAPPHFAMMCDLAPAPPPPALELLMSGGSTLTTPLYSRMRGRWPMVPIANWYGLSESGTGQTLNFDPDIERAPTAIGRPVWPTQVRIVDDAGASVESGAEGELWMRAPGQMREYFRNPEQTTKRLHNAWLRTGDRARMDSRGLIYLVGRDEERINRGGFKFYPAEVESALEANEKVREAAAVAVPHPVLGEDVIAFVVPAIDQAVGEDELRSHCRRFVAPNKVPSRILIKQFLPRGDYGKVIRRELSREYAELAAIPPAGEHPNGD
jgi:acyl-CoA synthetase (AMP-forming)/AMP-acid ligase II